MTGAEVRAAWDAVWSTLETTLAADKALDDAFIAAGPVVPGDLTRRWDESGEAVNKAEWAVFFAPAPTPAAVEWKLRLLERKEISFDSDLATALIHDINRLVEDR